MIEPIVRLARFENYDPRIRRLRRRAEVPAARGARFLLGEWRATGDQRSARDGRQHARAYGARAARTTTSKAASSATRRPRDWSVPHFEKMAEDHAGLHARARRRSALRPPSARRVRETLVSAAGYVRDGVARSTRPVSSPAARTPTRSTSRFRSRSAARSPRLRRPPQLHELDLRPGERVLRGRARARRRRRSRATHCRAGRVHDAVLDADGFSSTCSPRRHAAVRGLLTDQVAYLRALLDAHEMSGEARFRDAARGRGRTIPASSKPRTAAFTTAPWATKTSAGSTSRTGRSATTA